ncbi:MAG TPA: glycosyl transferase family 1, partial [Paraburkholderia sp.]
TDEDRALGAAGLVVPIANPAAFAQAVLELLGDEPRWLAAQQAGLARVRRFYTKAQMIDQYRVLYERLAAAPDRTDRKGGAAGCPMHLDAPATASGAQHAQSQSQENR